VIANQLNDKAIKSVQDIFKELDLDGDGTLTIEEMELGMEKVGLEGQMDELKSLMQEIDTDGSGELDYTEFVAATLDKQAVANEDVAWNAFRIFDRGDKEEITRENLVEVLCGGDESSPEAKEVIEGAVGCYAVCTAMFGSVCLGALFCGGWMFLLGNFMAL
jgi:calcium-dependent protein kinase